MNLSQALGFDFQISVFGFNYAVKIKLALKKFKASFKKFITRYIMLQMKPEQLILLFCRCGLF